MNIIVEGWDCRLDQSWRAYCPSHLRIITEDGLCPTCQREAQAASVRRASEEIARHAAVDGELVQLAEMYGL